MALTHRQDRDEAVLGAARPIRRPRLNGWALSGVAVALMVAAPLIVVPTGFFSGGLHVDDIVRTLLPSAIGNSMLLAVGVGAGTLVLGGALAVLVSFYDFPGRRWLDWALVLPMAMPSYVLVFVVLGQYGMASPLQSNLFGDGLRISGIRTRTGAIVVLTAVLYPYVYVLARSAFMGQSRQSLEAARSLGRSYGQAIWRVAVPLARPALAAGTSLTVMESLADFGTVDLLGVQALTSAIYRVWNGAFDQAAALQLATVLVALSVTMLFIERALRGRAAYHQALGRGDAVVPRRMSRGSGIAAALACCALLAVVFVIPVLQLVAWSVETIADGTVDPNLANAVWSTLLIAAIAAAAAVFTGTAVAYGLRVQPSRIARSAARLATIGYGIPGTVVAVAVYVPLVWVDRQLVHFSDRVFSIDPGLIFTGSILGLVIAYLVRFHALSFLSIESRMSRVPPNLDDAARALGADRTRLLTDVHVPLLLPGIATAALLVLVDVMKELPATALLRPLGRDTLAITVWEATKDSRLDVAALPALLIVAVGLVPVIMLIHLQRVDGARLADMT
jgi:iron(III) transport system permease protein